MDYGIVSLFAVQLVIAFLTGLAWWSLKDASSQAKDVENRIKGETTGLRATVDQLRADLSETRSMVATIKGTHYDSLLKRIDQAEDRTIKFERAVELCTEKTASVAGRLSVFQRHYKIEKENPEPAPDGSKHPDAIRFDAEPPAQRATIPGNFGRKAGRG